MITAKQKLAFDKVVESGGNIGKAMVEAGYTKATSKTPQKLTESKGWKTLCEESGLTEDFLVNALVEDIKSKPKNRKAELELGFKVVGRLSDKAEANKTLVVLVSGETLERYNVSPTRDTETSSA